MRKTSKQKNFVRELRIKNIYKPPCSMMAVHREVQCILCYRQHKLTDLWYTDLFQVNNPYLAVNTCTRPHCSLLCTWPASHDRHWAQHNSRQNTDICKANEFYRFSGQFCMRLSLNTTICVQAQTANVFSRLFTLETSNVNQNFKRLRP